MKKKLIYKLFCVAMTTTLLMGCGNESTEKAAVDNQAAAEQQKAEEFILPVSDAAVTGQGINEKSEVVDTAYVSDFQSVTNFGTNSTITYTVPEGVNGTYDIYVDYGKSFYPFGTTQASLIVNGKDKYVMPAKIEGCKEEDFSDLYSKGKFKMAEKIDLKTGDTLTVQGNPGFELEYGETKVSTMAAVGDLYLYTTGTEVATGYDGGTVKEQQEADASDPLSGKNIVWLGSSVTYGMQSGGYSMADAIEDNHAAANCYKYAISGTTLVNDAPSSYVERLKEISPDMKMDVLVVQLSTNDASQEKELGTLSEGEKVEDFDDTTIMGAIEYIIAYAKETWNCPVVFYTGTFYESEQYSAMVDALLQIQKKWDIGVVDLWNNEEMKNLYNTEEYHTYMADDVHPTRDGYVKWWTPVFEEYLSEYLAE